jgi:Cu/Ag efflux pump CusA
MIEYKLDSLLKQIDMTWYEKTRLYKAYYISQDETALRRAAIDTLTQTLNDSTVFLIMTVLYLYHYCPVLLVPSVLVLAYWGSFHPLSGRYWYLYRS